MNLTLGSFLSANNLSFGAASRALHCDKSTISKIVSRSYPNWEQKESEIISRLNQLGYTNTETDCFTAETDLLVPTRSVANFKYLAGDLIDPESSLSSSIGMVIGTAERGKTHTAKWFCEENKDAIYILYIDGSSKVQVLRDICEALANVRPYSFGYCLATIEAHCKYTRKLIIVDEADKCPVPVLEMLRGINERCNLPFLLVGEDGLKTKIDRIPRLHSRIRKPVVVFEPVKEVDVAVFYKSSCGIMLEKDIAEALARRANGGFRSVVNDCMALAKMSRASGVMTVTKEMIAQLQ